ncbi:MULTISPECIES: hypothetical protein [unclassified Eikenella]|uniref:hypothetical protein n=1 Tax=unclassified Eikenella TaxID=2639367 RepID=UPI00114C9607|nr:MULTISPECIES: hypothetical protein [unclassified Eikenella]
MAEHAVQPKCCIARKRGYFSGSLSVPPVKGYLKTPALLNRLFAFLPFLNNPAFTVILSAQRLPENFQVASPSFIRLLSSRNSSRSREKEVSSGVETSLRCVFR